MYNTFPSGILHGDRDVKRGLEKRLDWWEKKKRLIIHPTMGMEAKMRATPLMIEAALTECEQMIKHYRKNLRQY